MTHPLLQRRRVASNERLEQLRARLTDADQECSDVASVYATGSFAREEASEHSDLDLFIVGTSEVDESRQKETKRNLTRLKEILLEAKLIRATEALGIPEFSGDGEYLKHYSIWGLKKSIGTPDDDATNTFTARILLLLESKPLVGDAVHTHAVNEVLEEYWKDFHGHEESFVPGFLANDILRMWRTFCVNYEARTASDPPRKKAKRKLKNYKLKHSRMLTCYSAILFLLGKLKARKTVTLEDAQGMVAMTPTARVEYVANEHAEIASEARALLTKYEDFLAKTDAAEATLIDTFLDPEQGKRLIETAEQFGDSLYGLLFKLGVTDGVPERFYRLLIV
ncbi:MAG: nucleotidyltransferase domain-containing protein [Polyangiaceae bacterium]